MFTGIITDVGEILSAEEITPNLRRLRIASQYDPASIALGASIACAGVCLTVTAVEPVAGGAVFQVETAAETLNKTLARTWARGTRLNLERALKIGDELGGHLVTGHVDGVARLVAVEALPPNPDEPWSATAKFTIEAPADLARFIAPKGSLTLDGTSLTVNEVEGARLTVLIIPHTLQVTTWGQRKAGDALHVEIDIMARYAARLAEARGQGY